MTIKLRNLDRKNAELANSPKYLKRIRRRVEGGEEVVLIGRAPIWLYLKVAHGFNGKAGKLVYYSPVTKDVVIFDHTPY